MNIYIKILLLILYINPVILYINNYNNNNNNIIYSINMMNKTKKLRNFTRTYEKINYN